MVRPPAVADATASTGFSRAVTVELLLMHSPRCRGDRRNVTHNSRAEATLLYSARRSAETDTTFEQFDAGPGGYAKLGAKPTRSRHCKRLASRQNTSLGAAA